ncbi:EpsG family protein, partial [Citrobacter portucalensis]|uniref:EpsG family protein n=9 Tax=Enterobacteriaceae TaxID=543 RepID=UPI0022447C4C
MGFYLLTALVLWILSTPRVIGGIESGVGLLFSTVIIFIFFAFRYETGFDWMVYQQYFNAVKASDFMALTGETVSMEPFYYLLNYIISRAGDFQLLLFVIATINIICAFKFFRYFNASTTFCFAFVFCWALLPMWMGTIRQSLAVSMTMIAIMKRIDDKNKSSFMFMMVAVLFQYSAIMYSFIYFNRVFSYLIKRSSVFVPAFFAFYLISPAGIGQFAVNFISSLGIPFI